MVPGGPPSALGSVAAALSRRVLRPHGRAGRGAGLRLALTTARSLCGARESRSQSWRHRSSHRRRQPCGPFPRNRCSRCWHRLRTHVSRADGRNRVSHSLARSCVPPAAHPCRPQAGVPTCAAWGSGSVAPGCPGNSRCLVPFQVTCTKTDEENILIVSSWKMAKYCLWAKAGDA